MCAKPTPTFVHRGFESGTTCSSIVAGDVLLVGTGEGRCSAFSATTHVRLFTVFEDKEKRAIVSCGEVGRQIFVHVRGYGVLVGVLRGNHFEQEKTISTDHYGFCRVIACGEKLVVPDYKNEQHFVRIVDSTNDVRIGPLNSTNSDGTALPAPMAATALNEECSCIVLGMEDGRIRVFDVISRKEVFSISAFADSIFGLSFDFSSRTLAVSSVESPIRLFRCDQQGILEASRDIAYPEWSKGCSTLAFSPGGKLLSAGFWNGFVRIYSMKTAKMLCSMDYHEQIVNVITWTTRNEGTPLLVCSQDGNLTIWGMYKDMKTV